MYLNREQYEESLARTGSKLKTYGKKQFTIFSRKLKKR